MKLFSAAGSYRMPAFLLAAGLCVAFGAGSLAAPQPAQAMDSAPAAEAPADSQQVESEAEAREVAATHNHEVVVADQSSPNVLVKARPDGYMEAVSSQVPEQAEVGGVWTAVDTTLVEKESGYEPKVAAVPVRIGKGGSPLIVSVKSESGDWVSESWPYGDLPVPTVSKSVAVFANVLPDVDLRVTATKAGMREVLVVKTADAAADPRLDEVRLTIKGARLVMATETDTMQAHTGSGDPVVAATPLWWDSSHESASAESPGAVEPKAVEATVDGSQSVLDVGAVTDGDVTYPLYVDPDWSAYLQYDWYTDRAYPNQAYLNPPENSVGYGIQNGVGYLSRAFYRFDTSFLAGKSVSSAHFDVVQNWANSCASTWTQLWQYGGSAVGFTWNTDPGLWVRAIDAQAYNNGGPCSPNPAWVGFSATPTAQDAATYSAPFIVLALRTADEGNSLSRKHFRWDAKLTVTYNSRPNQPANPAMTAPSRGCSTDPNNPSYVYGKAKITMKVNVTDPDTDQLTAANFFLKRISTGAVKTTPTSFQAQGANLTYTIDPASATLSAVEKLVDGEKYAWSARGSDNIQDSATDSPWCYFVVDSSAPALPTVSIDTSGGARIGSPLTATITPAPGEQIAGYQLWWTDTAKTSSSPAAPVTSYTTELPGCGAGVVGTVRVICASASGGATVTVAPIANPSTLWVAAYDKAGNVSFDAATNSSAAGAQVDATLPLDLSGGHLWKADTDPPVGLSDVIGTAAVTMGSFNGWGTDAGENDPQLTSVGLTALNRYVKAGVGHATEVDGGQVPGYTLEFPVGHVARYGAGSKQPVNSQVLYACKYGVGNMLSTSATCEGTGLTGRPLGYDWKTAADVPSGYQAREIFRCRIGTDYFVSVVPACEGGAAVEGSRGFVAVYVPTTTAAGVVDTTKSFTVSARVKANGGSEAQTIVSASGATNAGFYLQNSGGYWQFCVRSQGATLMTACAKGAAIPATPRFVTVSGVWDAINKQVMLVVHDEDLTEATTTSYTPPADDKAATGAVMFGAAGSGSTPLQILDGQIADVSLYPVALPRTALSQVPVPAP
ncbi:hypothetical protein ABIC47_000283 [Leifsonia sp. 563]|uniref:LamG-like jellyroll fold domain-containing protein n=1 Tax=Leifsonia sp. 563 TaxID=3156412 RepID=UPI00339AC193